MILSTYQVAYLKKYYPNGCHSIGECSSAFNHWTDLIDTIEAFHKENEALLKVARAAKNMPCDLFSGIDCRACELHTALLALPPGLLEEEKK